MIKIRTWIAGALLQAFVLAALPAVAILTDASLHKASAQTISNIVVNGNERITRATILTYVTIEPGRRASPVEVDETLRALFATGLFKDVDIDVSGRTLVIQVVENPIINGIGFVGNDKLKEDDLNAIVLTKPRGVFSEDQVNLDVSRIKDAYRSIGRFNAVVKASVEPLDRNRVNIVFRIDESDKTGIAQINFVGNKAFGDSRLRNAISTRTTGLLSFLRSDDIYDETRLAADEERLRQFYFNNGYPEFEVISSVVDLDEDKNKFFITITVSEGKRYRYGRIEIDVGLLDIDPEELRPLVETKEGSIYDARQVERSLEALSIAAATRGFAFAQVRPRGELVEGERINIAYAIDQGPRVFIERINIVGNTRTREYVIRREFDIAEGDAFSQALIDRAERRIRNLRLFERVNVSTSRGSGPDRIVVNVAVEEQPTGDVSFGVGADLSGGFLTNIAITERNFLGRGHFVRAAVGLGTGNQTYDFSFTEPFFLGRRIAAGFDLFRRDSQDQDSRSFDVSNTGFSLRFNFPLTENFSLGTRYTFDRESLSDVDGDAPVSIQTAFASDPDTITSSVSYILEYNSLDNNLNPTSGLRLNFEQEFAGVGGDVAFVKTQLRGVKYQEISANREIIGLLRGRAGNVTGLGEDVRILDNFFAGGDLVRGFENRGIGPRDSSAGVGVSDDALGGRNFFGVTAEVQFPAPVIPRSLGVKAALFADAGSLFDLDAPPATLVPGSDDFSVRSSVGGGILWDSPLGPIRADFAHVLSDEDFDDRQFFRIGGGTRF
ncbi:MAG: outer membrane protein assembly factor BamA [Pseudomonadota bacterium]